MISYHKGDLLESQCDIIAHQVNLQGVMGGGLARQIAEKYPLCEIRYKEYIGIKNKLDCNLLGEVFYYSFKGKNPIIANCFTQNEDFTTNYSALRYCFNNIKNFMMAREYKTLGVPVGYGSTIANGNKNIIEEIINYIFQNEEIELQWWKYDK